MKTGEEIMEMFPGDLRRIAEVAGVEAAVRIARAFRGCLLYVPGLDELTRMARDEMIRKDYDEGIHINLLARRYGLTVRRVRMILNASSCEIPQEMLDLLSEKY